MTVDTLGIRALRVATQFSGGPPSRQAVADAFMRGLIRPKLLRNCGMKTIIELAAWAGVDLGPLEMRVQQDEYCVAYLRSRGYTVIAPAEPRWVGRGSRPRRDQET